MVQLLLSRRNDQGQLYYGLLIICLGIAAIANLLPASAFAQAPPPATCYQGYPPVLVDCNNLPPNYVPSPTYPANCWDITGSFVVDCLSPQAYMCDISGSVGTNPNGTANYYYCVIEHGFTTFGYDTYFFCPFNHPGCGVPGANVPEMSYYQALIVIMVACSAAYYYSRRQQRAA